jgi:hypothetical protein
MLISDLTQHGECLGEHLMQSLGFTCVTQPFLGKILDNLCFNIVVGFGNGNTKIQLTFIAIWIAYYCFY